MFAFFGLSLRLFPFYNYLRWYNDFCNTEDFVIVQSLLSYNKDLNQDYGNQDSWTNTLWQVDDSS